MNKKKCKIILPIVLAAVVLAGAGIWQAARPKEVTNYDVEFEAVSDAFNAWADAQDFGDIDLDDMD